jgi:prophage antirepressor-like protein
MNKLEVFEFEGNRVRTQVDANGNPLFCVKDVCTGLFIVNSRQASTVLKDNERVSVQWTTSGGLQKLTFTTESGLYKLIMQSKKEEAQKFKDWICETVLPSIRKTGSYSMIPAKPDYVLPNNFKEALLMLIEAEDVKEALTNEIKLLQPKADFYDAVIPIESSIDVGAAAKVLNCGMGRNKLFEFLRDRRLLQDDNEPYQKYVNQGLFEVELIPVMINGIKDVKTKTLVTPKGLEYINKLIKAA